MANNLTICTGFQASKVTFDQMTLTGLGNQVGSQVDADVSEECAASICRVIELNQSRLHND
jgi:hypothetical protein